MMELDILTGSHVVGVPSHEGFLQNVSTCLESQLPVHPHYHVYTGVLYSPSDFVLGFIHIAVTLDTLRSIERPW